MKPVRVLQLILTLGLCTGPLAAQPVPSQDSAFVDADFVGDGSRCVSVSRFSEITVWDLKNGKKLKSLSRSPCLSFAVSPDGRRVACGGWEGEIAITDLGV